MKDEGFAELMTSVKQAGKIRRRSLKPARVTTFRPADIRAIRERLKTTQDEFAMLIGVSVATLRNWEQGRRKPDGPALALLRVAARNPKAVVSALHEAKI
jgi:putative transcriptional regulator